MTPVGGKSVGRICFNTVGVSVYLAGTGGEEQDLFFFNHFNCCSKGKFTAYYLTYFYLVLSHGSERMCRRLSIRESNSVIYIYRQLCFPENFFFFFVGCKSD